MTIIESKCSVAAAVLRKRFGEQDEGAARKPSPANSAARI